jgi:hypothetical protein
MEPTDEVRIVAEQLKHLAATALRAINEENDILLAEVLDLREPLLQVLHDYAAEAPDLILACPLVHDAARLELKVAAAARLRRDDLYNKWVCVRDRAALANAYAN